ncbi:MAG: hypothetical protein ACJAYU_005429 [Bradymonadia bacterium]|jgi:hypothetical protein
MRGSARRQISIVPLQEGPLQLPDISFEYYNPWTGEYQTRTHTPPLLTISGQNPNLEAVAVEETAPELDWLATLPEPRVLGESSQRTSVIGPAFFSALVAPAFFFALVLLRARAIRRREESSGDRRRVEAASNAKNALENAGPSEMGAAMRTYLTDVTDRAARGLRYRDVEALVSDVSGAAVGASFASVLEAVETARFAGGDSDRLRADALAAIAEMEAGQ